MPFLRTLELKPDAPGPDAGHPFDVPAVRGLGRLDLSAPVTFLVGENGSGKSTLIEAIAIKAGFNPEGGTKNFTSALRPSESVLCDWLVMAREGRRERGGFFLRAETMFNLSTEVEEQRYTDYGWARLHEMSHGEAFLWVANERFRDHGLFILDEPESALSPQRQLALLARIHDLAQHGSQFVISTHSPILMASPDARIYQEGIAPIAYEDTEHFTVTRTFLQDHRRMLRYLLG